MFGDAIEGALASGYENTAPPPEGHWLTRFWMIGLAEGAKKEGFLCMGDTTQT
jgi:hypothetical protein